MCSYHERSPLLRALIIIPAWKVYIAIFIEMLYAHLPFKLHRHKKVGLIFNSEVRDYNSTVVFISDTSVSDLEWVNQIHLLCNVSKINGLTNMESFPRSGHIIM